MVDQQKGSLVISLDFELYWGLLDLPNSSKFREHVGGVHEALPAMLELFSKYNVRVTVATVGLIFCKDKQEVSMYAPTQKPTYENLSLSNYENGYIESIRTETQHLYFAPQLIELLQQYSNIEIGTHTFGHYYCWEKGQTVEQFEADIMAAIRIAKDRGIDIKSVVFPRNNVSQNYLDTCVKHNILAYRGNAPVYFEQKKTFIGTTIQRVARLIDTYVNLSRGKNLVAYADLNRTHGAVDIPGCRFFRAYRPHSPILEKLKIHRIKEEMRSAAKQNKIYHIWWHPLNFGVNIKENLAALEVILKYYDSLHKKYGMQSHTMADFIE